MRVSGSRNPEIHRRRGIAACHASSGRRQNPRTAALLAATPPIRSRRRSADPMVQGNSPLLRRARTSRHR
jgi:hypothetical protein